MRLVLIHGRGQGGKDEEVLAGQWRDALAAGLSAAGLGWPDEVDVAFPFYGDRLDTIVAQIGSPVFDAAIVKGPGVDTRALEVRAELLEELARAHGITDAEILAHYDGEVVERGPLNWAWVQALMRALDRSPLGGGAIHTFTRDVSLYITYPTVRRAIDGIVAEHLRAGPCVVVGHSLGSVVAYNVLRGAAADVDVVRFVTLGSPLGMRAIRSRLDTPLAMPACAREWFNAFDPRDGIALYPLDARHFPIDPPIDNYGEVDNHTDDRHGIVGYLDDRVVARRIHAALAGG